MPIVFRCSSCSYRIKVADESAGKRGKCPKCATPLLVPDESEDSATIPIASPAPGLVTPAIAATGPAVAAPSSPPPSSANGAATTVAVARPVPTLTVPANVPMRVVVVDLNMPFASMVGFMVKWSLAAIPAMIILGFIFICFCIVAALIFGVPGRT